MWWSFPRPRIRSEWWKISINPVYDFEKGDDYGIGSVTERAELFRRCERGGVGISVMKPFHGGKLLDKKSSPLKAALTRYQCIQYALDRPGVLTVVPGVRNMSDLEQLLGFAGVSTEEKDYAAISDFTTASAYGNCVYCNHCQPCPADIDVGLVNKYYDLSLAGDHDGAGELYRSAAPALFAFRAGRNELFRDSQTLRLLKNRRAGQY